MDVYRNWFYNNFVTKFLLRKGLPAKAVLLVDNAPVHDIIQLGEIWVEFLPPNTTSLIQPMDQGPIAALEKLYPSCYGPRRAQGCHYEDKELEYKGRHYTDRIMLVADHREDASKCLEKSTQEAQRSSKD